jgi:hypothetical protein
MKEGWILRLDNAVIVVCATYELALAAAQTIVGGKTGWTAASLNRWILGTHQVILERAVLRPSSIKCTPTI